MSFADLKKKSSSNLQFLQKELEKTVSNKNVDDRFWKPEVDTSGNGYAVIRFLPAPEGETVPWAKVYSHAFQGPGGWYIENSLTTLGDKDPVGEVNRRLWNSGSDVDKDTARKQKRKLSYYSNIVVVKDPKHPENEGKVFLYKYGKKIHDKILAAMQPEFQDETPVNVFDLWEGANFKLKIKKVAGFWNYDSSEFDSVAALSSDDSELETIWKQEHSLEAFTAREQFKSYEDLEKRLNLVLGAAPRPSAPSVDSEEYEPTNSPEWSSGGFNDADINPAPSSFRQQMSAPAQSPVKKEAVVEDDDALSYFASLAADD
tara:strand:- start:9809 stop:10756 length:948 start_codon:yes stop_codon:yes gene_type:complete